MKRFKAVASKVQVPHSVAVDALMNTLYFKSLFREDLYRNPTTSLQDAIARSNNFIRMEEDTAAILKKLNTETKPATVPKAPEARQEPRQHTSGSKPNQPKSFVYVVEDKNASPQPLSLYAKKVGMSGKMMKSRKPLRHLRHQVLDQLSQTCGVASTSLRHMIQGTAGIC